MLLRFVFILSVLFPSFAFAHVDDEPRSLSCYERLANLVTRKKQVQATVILMLKQVSRHPYNSQAFQSLMSGYGYEAAAQLVFTQFLRDGIWILESETGKEEQIAVRSFADNRPYFPSIHTDVRFKTQNNPMDADFYKYVGITSHIEFLNFYNVSETGFSMRSEHHYMPGGSTDLTFGFDNEGFLETLEFGVVLGEGYHKRDLRMKFKVKGYLSFPDTSAFKTFDIRRTE